MSELDILNQELRDAIQDLEDCEHARAEGRTVDAQRSHERYWTLTDRVLELERRIERLRTALSTTETRT